MYEISYGEKYKETEDLSMVEIAKLVRAELKKAFPGFKFSVSNSRGCSALRVRMTGAPEGMVLEQEITDRYGKRNRPTAATQEILDKANALIQAYNYDGSEIQSDYFNVRFYDGRPELDSKLCTTRPVAPAEAA